MRLLSPLLLTALLPLAAAFAPSAIAGGAVSIDVFQGRPIVQTENGISIEHIVPLETATPGEIVVYQYTLRTGAQAVENLVIDAQVPLHTTYLSQSANMPGWELLLSADGKTYAAEGNLFVVEIDETIRPAKAADIRHIRWRRASEIGPESLKILRFRTTIDR